MYYIRDILQEFTGFEKCSIILIDINSRGLHVFFFNNMLSNIHFNRLDLLN